MTTQTRCRFRELAAALLAVGILALAPLADAKDFGFTTDDDFDGGTLSSVQHDSIHDQLQLSGSSVTEPFIYIANHRYGTVSKVDTATGNEVARYPVCLNNVGNTNLCPAGNYYTGPQSYCDWSVRGHCPSRTAVDLNGDMWVANRAFGQLPSVTKIAGDFGRCVDRNGNGIIETSMDTSGNGRIDLTEGDGMPETGTGEWRGQNDECVLFTVQVGPKNALARGLAVDGKNNVWVGMYNTGWVYKLKNADGALLGSYQNGSNIYGLATDGLGYIYNSELSSGRIRQMNTTTGALIKTIDTPYPTYGIAVEGSTQVAWLAVWDYYGGVLKVDFKNSTYKLYQNPIWGNWGRTRGVAIDNQGILWVSNYDKAMIGKFDPATGTWLASYGVGSGPIGVAIDTANMIWTANDTGNATRIDPATGARLDSKTLGIGPYSYSDMTGYQLTQSVVQQGTWTGTADCGEVGRDWGTVAWNQDSGVCPPAGCVPPDTEIQVDVRAYDGATPGGSWVTIENGVPFTGQQGQYLEVKVILRVNGAEAVSPVLTDITATPTNIAPVCVAGPATVLACKGATSVALNGTGSSDADENPLTFAWSGGTCGEMSPSIPQSTTAATTGWLDGTGVCSATCAFELAVNDGHVSTLCAQEVTLVDDAPPMVLPPPPAVVECNDGGLGIATTDPQLAGFFGAAAAFDECQGPLALTNDAPAWLGLGTNTQVSFTTADVCGFTAATSSSIVVLDTGPPELVTCPKDAVVVLDPVTCEGAVAHTAQVLDACDGPSDETHEYAFTGPATATHTFSFVDTAGNPTSCTQTVRAVDKTKPALAGECPADETLALDPLHCTATKTVTVTGQDGCSGALSDSHTFSFTAPGAEERTYTLKDATGNKTTCTHMVTAADSAAPAYTANPIRKLYPPSHQYVEVKLSQCGKAYDGCTGTVDLDGPGATITSVTSDEPEDTAGFDDGATTDDVVIQDAHTVLVRAERKASGNGRVYQIHFDLSDGVGNKSDRTCTVLVPLSRREWNTTGDDGPAYTVAP